nr:hypothetical protein [Bacteroidales bacterium]
VFGSSDDIASAWKLAQTVARNDVDIYRLGRKLTVGDKTFVPDSAFVVPVRQASHRMVEALFEIRESYSDSLSYDITGWTMPMSFNLPYAKVASATLGDKFDEAVVPAGKYSRASYAYAFEWTGFYAPRALYRLLSEGVFAKVAQGKFSAEGKVFSHGSIIVPLGEAYQSVPAERIHALMAQIAREDWIDVYALSSGFAGGHNLGSANFATARLPRVAVIGSNEASSVPVGDLWYLMDQQYRIPLSIIPAEGLASLDLDRYNVLFVTAAHGSMSAGAAAKVKSWVERGGTLVTLEQGHQFLRKLGLEALKTKAQAFPTDISYDNIATAARAQSIPGVILDAKIDVTHPLGWGYRRAELPVFKNNAIMLEPLQNRLRTPLMHPEKVLLSGNMLPRLQEMLADTPVAVLTALGSGRIVSLTIDPAFRGVWYGTSKLAANAMFWPETVSAVSLR